jgi:peptidoglycan/LPS O-acetylase OafA/YrhL
MSALKSEPLPIEARASRLTGRLPSVDGWRALSIIMVLGGHSTGLEGFPSSGIPACLSILTDGNLGVRFFFVISGFLITYLLIKEQDQNGSVSLKKFYLRRALRILPVYFAYLLVIAILQYFTRLHQNLIAWIGDLTFTVNLVPRGVISGHLWSLSVEEQFYLLWPITFVWLNQHKKYTRWVFAVPITVAIFCHVISYTNHVPWIVHPLFHFYSPLVNFDSLAVGCMAAFALAYHENEVANFFSGWRRLAGILFGVLMILLPWLNISLLSPVLAIIGNPLQAIGFGILLLTSVLYPRGFLPLNWPIVIQIGVVSYSIYIWQQIICASPEIYGLSNVWWMSFPWWLLAALAIGFASYYGFERPLLKLRARFRRY